MTFEVYYKNTYDGRAPSAVVSTDYTFGGTVEASSKSLAVVTITARSIGRKFGVCEFETPPRAISVGDVIKDESGAYWIYTPEHSWASVAFEEVQRETDADE